ncbi:pre-rRNA-processing protein TSR2 [Fistulifera solaris]|uniref:Pre-rRNA-processing protein TSR2 n=1 Tax=Fistulifera solaris TaxID=1519565 RepID=A0A1Z5JU60_FISSO|nr:pre-rRNA-processing protein TSR2 [Fistulifera solaris]|eukprot:GAX17560.1 pre-rRNA-processing protein TSR2 [Fistulifera solaris]
MNVSSSKIDEFRAGVTACLRSWSALRTAVQAGWGGVDSLAKAELLRQYIFEQFNGHDVLPKNNNNMDCLDLEDHLAIFMEEEFSVVLEDDSERQIAETIWRMYEQCHQGDTTLARQMIAMAETALLQVADYPVQVQSTECDDDDDDEAMEADEAPTLIAVQGTSSLSARDYASQYLFGPPRGSQLPAVPEGPVRQLGEAAPPAPEPEMDEDGFMIVTTKGKRRNE